MVNNAYKDRMKILKNVHVSYHSDEKPRIIDVSVTWKVVLTNKRLLGYDSKGRMIHEIDVVNHIRRYESDGSILRIIPKSGKSITLNVAGNIKTWITAFEELHIGADI
jgi:hypothetical protein